MKKFLAIFTILILGQNISFANYNDIYIADIQYDWINKTEIEKEAIINEIHDIIFEEEIGIKKGLKQEGFRLK